MTIFEKNPRIQVGVYISPWGLFLWSWFHAKQGQSIFMVFQLPETLGEKIQVSCLVTPQGWSPEGPRLDEQGQSAPGLPGLQLGTAPC